jgi:hypothetical protein
VTEGDRDERERVEGGVRDHSSAQAFGSQCDNAEHHPESGKCDELEWLKVDEAENDSGCDHAKGDAESGSEPGEASDEGP